MSVINGEPVVAYNLKLKEKGRPMVVTGILRMAPTKEGGNPRYRFAGHDEDHPDINMSLMCNAERAKAASKELGLDIEDAEVKERKPRKPRKSCKEVAEEAEAKCEEKRSAKKPAAKRAAAKKSTKKPAAKRAAAKKPAKKAAKKVESSSDEE